MTNAPQPVMDMYVPQKQARRSLQDWLLALYVIFLPVQISLGDLHLAPSDISLMATLCLTPLGIVRLRHVKSAWSLWHIGIILMFGMGIMVAVGRTGYVTSYALLNKLVGMMVLFASYTMIVGQVDSWQKIRWILRLLIGSVAIQNAFFVGAFVLTRATGLTIPGLDLSEPRLSGLLIDPNAYGGLIGVGLAIHLLTRYSRQPLVKGVLGELTTISMAMGMMLTYSRSAWIGLGLLMLIVITLRPGTAFRMLLISAAAVFLILLALGSDYLNDMSQLSSRGSHEARLEQIDAAIPMFWESPIVGIGLGSFEYNYGAIIHNTPVWILTEFGMAGFAIFTGFVLWFLQKGIRAYYLGDTATKSVVLGLITASLTMIGLSLGIEALYQRHLWLMWALIASSHAVLSKAKHDTRLVAARNRRQESCA